MTYKYNCFIRIDVNSFWFSSSPNFAVAIHFPLAFYVFSCVHDCIFLSNSVGHDSLSSRLIWSVRVWLCTQFGGLMSSLGSRKPSFFFFDEENQNELKSILIKQSHLYVTSAEQLRDFSSTYRFYENFFKTRLYWFCFYSNRYIYLDCVPYRSCQTFLILLSKKTTKWRAGGKNSWEKTQLMPFNHVPWY